MTAERLANFTPSDEYTDFLVTVLANRFDKDEGKLNVRVTAIGEIAARAQAVEKVKADYPSAMAVRVARICDGCGLYDAPHEAHEGRCRHYSQTGTRVTMRCECGERAA